MADKLLWDFEAMSYLEQMLHTAGNELMTNHAEVRSICCQMQQLLQQGTGYSRRITDETESMARKLSLIGEKTEALYRAARQVNELFRAAEAEIIRMPEDANMQQEQAAESGSMANNRQTPFYQVNESPSGWTVVPEWLERAADRMFG